MTARMLRGAMQYVSTPGVFETDDRKIFLDNVAAAVRGTDFIGIIDRRIMAVLISGTVDLSARSNSVKLDRRGHTVYLDRTGLFDEAFIPPTRISGSLVPRSAGGSSFRRHRRHPTNRCQETARSAVPLPARFWSAVRNR